MIEIVGVLEHLTLIPSGDYVAWVYRRDVTTAHQGRHVELLVTPAAIDGILAMKGTLDQLIFKVTDGKIVSVRRQRAR
jgi:hypothetical protein